jgi:hypothetical protein
MTTWLAATPIPVLALLIVVTLYLVVAIVLAVLVLARRRGFLSSLGPLSPGLLAPMGLIFGLLVGFLVADVLADRSRAEDAVSREASALRDTDLLMAVFPAQQSEVRRLLAAQIDRYVADEWPLMETGEATIAYAPPGLVRVQAITVGLPVRTDGQRIVQDRLVTVVERALEARRSRLALSGSVIDPLRLTMLFLVAAVTIAAMGCVQCDRLRRSAVAMALLATAMSLALILLCAQAAPFAGYFAVSPDLLLQVRPVP